MVAGSSTASLGQGPSAGAVSVSHGLGYQGLADGYQFNGSASASSSVVVVPVTTETQTVTETATSYTTTTTTITRTVTGPGGVQVVTEVQTITVPVGDRGLGVRKLLLPLGLLAFLVLLLLARR